MRDQELQGCVSADQHAMIGDTTETAPADAGNAFGSLTTTTIRESKMAGYQSTHSNAGAAA